MVSCGVVSCESVGARLSCRIFWQVASAEWDLMDLGCRSLEINRRPLGGGRSSSAGKQSIRACQPPPGLPPSRPSSPQPPPRPPPEPMMVQHTITYTHSSSQLLSLPTPEPMSPRPPPPPPASPSSPSSPQLERPPPSTPHPVHTASPMSEGTRRIRRGDGGGSGSRRHKKLPDASSLPETRSLP